MANKLSGMSCRSFAIATVLSIFMGIPLAGCSNPLADAHYNNALDKYDEGNYEAAIKLLDNAITIRELNITEIEEMQKYHYRIMKMLSRITIRLPKSIQNMPLLITTEPLRKKGLTT